MIRVKNQFLFSPDSITACMPISILAIYHLYNERERVLDDDDWTLIMRNGTRLWKVWRESNTKDAYPAADEVLSLHTCSRFVNLFGNNPLEYCEWAGNTKTGVVLAESLLKMFEHVESLVKEEKKIVACLIVLPSAICLSVSCFRPNEYQYFDSHGNGRDSYCDFTIFTHPHGVIKKIYDRYNLRQLEKDSFCSYSAMLFVK